MKPLRIFYLMLLVLSLGLTFAFYYRNRCSDEALKETSAKLEQNMKELEESSKEIEKLNKIIAALQEDNSGFKSQLQALKKDRDDLQDKIARLTGEKGALEQKLLSLKELKKAIRIAKRMQKIERRSVKMAMLKRNDEVALQQGNRGYLVRQSRSTFKPSIKVKLEPIGKLSYSYKKDE